MTGSGEIDETRASAPQPSGARIGHFRLGQPLGRGGSGTVYLAEDLDIPGRRVALKLMRPDGITPDLASIRREAAALAALRHPNILVVHEIGESPQGVYLVTEFVPGGSLASRVARGALPIAEALPLARQAAGAIRSAHEKGILHLDIKPSNLLLGDAGDLKVADFGLAWIGIGGASHQVDSDASTISTPLVSTPPQIAGTAFYMAPEILQGSRPGAHADQFAFGVTLHEILAGRRPFEGPQWREAVLAGEPSIADALPSDLTRIVRRCTLARPQRRYPSMAEVVADLDAAIRRRSPERRRLRLVTGAAALALALLAGGWSFLRWSAARQARLINEQGRQALQAGDLDEARRAFLASLSASPGYQPACINLGSMAALEKNPAWAVTILSECAAKSPDSAIVLYNLGCALRGTGELGKAEDQLRRALAQSDGSQLRPFIINELAMVLLSGRRAEEALRLLQDAGPPASETIEGAILFKTQGIAMLEAEKFAEAQQVLRRALGGPLPPAQRAAAQAALGRALERSGDAIGAVEAYSQVLIDGSDADSVKVAEEGLARLQGAPATGSFR